MDVKVEIKPGTFDTESLNRNALPFTCTECERKYTTQYNLWEHFRRHHTSRLFHLSPGNTSKLSKYKCPECRKNLVSKTEMYVHRLSHMIDGFRSLKCFKCKNSHRSFKSLQQHIMEKHGVMEKWFCPVCPSFKTFKHIKLWEKHLATLHFNFNRNSREQKKYTCKECGESFFSKTLLGRHENKYHLGEVIMKMDYHLFNCELCGKSYDKQLDLRNHLKAVHLKQDDVLKKSK